MNTIYIKGNFSAADAATAAAIAAHGTVGGGPAFFNRDGLCPGAYVPEGMFHHKKGDIHTPGVVSLASSPTSKEQAMNTIAIDRTVATDVAYDRCYDCGSDMLPDAFPAHPCLPDFSGYPAGAVVDGEVWVRCTKGCRGGWRPA